MSSTFSFTLNANFYLGHEGIWSRDFSISGFQSIISVIIIVIIIVISFIKKKNGFVNILISQYQTTCYVIKSGVQPDKKATYILPALGINSLVFIHFNQIL